MDKLCILICTHNRLSLLKRTLDYLQCAELPAITVKICVVANACDDGTQAYLAEHAASSSTLMLPLEWIDVPIAGKSHALNVVIPQLAGWALAMVDDDHRIDSGYLIQIAAALNAYPEADMLCGKIIPDWDGREPTWIHLKGEFAIYPLPIPHYDLGNNTQLINRSQRLPGGGNWVVRPQVFTRVGTFSTELGPQGHNLLGAEDLDYVGRAVDAGILVRYCPEIIQFHYVDVERLRLSYLLQKAYQRSKSCVLISPAAAQGIPRYLWRKMATYLLRLCCSLYWPQTRFLLMRLACTLGDIAGHRRPNVLPFMNKGRR